MGTCRRLGCALVITAILETILVGVVHQLPYSERKLNVIVREIHSGRQVTNLILPNTLQIWNEWGTRPKDPEPGYLNIGNPIDGCKPLQWTTPSSINGNRYVLITFAPGSDSCSLDLKLRHAEAVEASVVMVEIVGPDDLNTEDIQLQHHRFRYVKQAALLSRSGASILHAYADSEEFVVSSYSMKRGLGYNWRGIPLLTWTSTLDALVQIYVCIFVVVVVAFALIAWGLNTARNTHYEEDSDQLEVLVQSTPKFMNSQG